MRREPSEPPRPGIEMAEPSVATHAIKRRERLGQSWETFPRNRTDGLAAVDEKALAKWPTQCGRRLALVAPADSATTAQSETGFR